MEFCWCVIFIDDGLIDDMGVIFVVVVVDDDWFVVILYEVFCGLGVVCNVGFDCVDILYVGFFDGDDEFCFDVLVCFVGIFEWMGSDFVVGVYVCICLYDGCYWFGCV